MNTLSLFTGIGLHDAGFQRAGFNIVGQVEIESWCRAVLEQHWPKVPRWSDVRGVTTESVRSLGIDCITGGFPCTDLSVAGKWKGIDRTTRSGLWREMFRIIRGIRPAWLIIENVPALRSRGYDRIADALERIGYALSPQVVGAEHAGAPHRRHRVWIVGRLAYTPINRLQWRAVPICERESRQPDADTERAGERAPELLANSARHEQRRQSEMQRPDRERIGATGDGTLANPERDGRREQVERRGSEGRAAGPAGSYGCRWPARPGEQQYEWEAPRLVEWPMGAATDVSARDLVRLARRSNRETLRAAGNANPIVCAEVIGRAVMRIAQQELERAA